jgi:(p)ppGpp synthase/HD superfamily hydrolase
MDEPVLEGPALLAAAMEVAAAAHSGLVDKAGLPYLSHPLRVAARLVGEGDQVVATGLLHDVIEDTAVTQDDLRVRGFPASVRTAVEALSKRPDEPYEDAIRRAAADPIAAKVKAADIADNSDPSRLALLDDANADRLGTKYDAARQLLQRMIVEEGEVSEDPPDGPV